MTNQYIWTRYLLFLNKLNKFSKVIQTNWDMNNSNSSYCFLPHQAYNKVCIRDHTGSILKRMGKIRLQKSELSKGLRKVKQWVNVWGNSISDRENRCT